MLNKRLSALVVFSVIVASFSTAQTGWVKDGIKINTVTTAMPFLRINSDARAGGMGDVGIATTPDINGSFLNPSNMAFVEKDYGVGISFTPWLKKLVNDIYLTSLSGYGKIKDKNGIVLATDKCDSSNTLIEYICGNDVGYTPYLTDGYSLKSITCVNGCSAGKCN